MPPKLMQVIRFDSLPLNQTYYTEEGYLVDRPILTSTGIFEYANEDGSIRRELRLPEDVFDPDSLASYRGKPVVLTHDAGLIDKDNVSDNTIGTILSEGYRSGENVRAEIIIHDTDEMKRSRLKELSLGYNLDLEETPGEWHGEHYDAIQRNIRVNHLALVRNARAGEQARLNIDSRESLTLLKGAKSMKKSTKTHRNDGQLSPEELAKAIAEYKAKKAGENAADEDDVLEEKEVVTSKPFAGAPGAPADPIESEKGEEPEKNEDEDEEEEQEMKDKLAEFTGDSDDEPIEEVVEEIKERHTDDDDIQKLCDIIDTLLAEREMAGAEKETANTDECDDPEDEEFKEDDDPVGGIDKINRFKKGTASDEEEEELEFIDKEEEEEHEDEDEGDYDFIDSEAVEELQEENEDEDDEEEEDKNALNMDSVDRIIRARIKVGTIGRQLNMDGLENMSLKAAKKAIIKAVRPGIRLDGKSNAYLNAAYQIAVDEVKSRSKKTTSYQKKQMFNKDSADVAVKSNMTEAEAARKRMMARQRKVSK